MTRADLLPFRLWQVAVPLVAAMVGAIAGLSPMLGVAAALGLVYVALVVQNLALGLTVFVGITFLESISGVGDLSAAKLAGGLLLLGWLAVAFTDAGPRQLVRDHPGFSAAALALGAWALMSALWAELPGEAFAGAQRWILNLAMFAIVYTAVREPRHVRWVCAVFVVGALFSAALGAMSGSLGADDVDRLAGAGVNANELGLLLVVAAILAAALGAAGDLPPAARAAAFLASGLALMGLLTTASRGALVGLVVALLIAPLLVGRGRRGAAVALTVLAVAGAGSYLVAVAPASSIERITAADATGTGRTEIWLLGWRMIQDKPFAGVGAENYGNSTIHYLLQPGGLTRSEFFVDENKVAHNVYLQVIAELGIVGLVLFAIVIAFALLTLLRAARLFERQGDRSMDLLSRGLLLALCGHLAAWTFSSDIYSKQMWLLLALAVAIGAIARSRAA